MTDAERERRATAAGWSPPDRYVRPAPKRFAIPPGEDTLVLPCKVATLVPGTDPPVLLYHEEPEPIRIRVRVGGEGPWPSEVL